MGSRLVSTYSPKSKAFDFGAWKAVIPLGVGSRDVEEDPDALEWLNVEWNAYEGYSCTGKFVVSGKMLVGTPSVPSSSTYKMMHVFKNEAEAMIPQPSTPVTLSHERDGTLLCFKVEWENVRRANVEAALFELPDYKTWRTGSWNSCAYSIQRYINKDLTIQKYSIYGKLKVDFTETQEVELDIICSRSLLQKAGVGEDYLDNVINDEDVRFGLRVGMMETMKRVFFTQILNQPADSTIKIRVSCYRCEEDEEPLFDIQIPGAATTYDPTFLRISELHRFIIDDAFWRVEEV